MRCGVDIGGTFTELITLDEEVRLVENAKATTTPDRWENGVDTIALTQPGRVSSWRTARP